MVDRRIFEELLKRNYGEPKMRFSVPINWIDEFEIFSNLNVQDPFGLSTIGAGERSRYYYIESLTYDFLNGRINVVAIDLQFIVKQCMILGDCNAIPATWAEASDEERLYGYLCACESGQEGVFPSDDSPCKMICPCG